MSLKNKWRALVLLVAVLTVGVVGAGCGSSDSGGSGDQPKVTLELALQSGCAFCLAIQHGAEDAAEANNVDLTVQSPPKPEVDSQVEQLQSVAATKPDVLILEPFDANALVAPVKQIVDGGAQAIMVDTDISDTSLRMSLVTSDNTAGGNAAGKAMGEAVGGKGEVLYVGYTPGATAVDERQQGFNDTLESDFPNISQATPVYAIDDAAAVATKVSATLESVPDLAGIFASTEAAAIGSVNALKSAGKDGDIPVVAYDGAPDEVQALKQGTISTLIVQKAYDMGKISVEQAADYVENGTKPDPEVTKTGIVIATKDNIDDPSVSKFLYPAK